MLFPGTSARDGRDCTPPPSSPPPHPRARLQAPGPLAVGMQIAAGLLASATSLEEVHALQNAIATDLVPATLDAAPYIPQALQEEVSDLLQALLSNVWQNTATQQFDQRPELVEREEKMQGIVTDHVSGLVAGVLQDLGREHESEVWPTGSGTLNVTSTFKILPIDAVAGSPLAVGETQVALGAAVQDLMTEQGYTEVCHLWHRARPVSRRRRSQIRNPPSSPLRKHCPV